MGNVLAAALFLLALNVNAQAPSPVGLWRTFNEHTGRAEGLVRIEEADGELRGRVVAVFSPPAPSPEPLCKRCPGELENKPVVGMQILHGLRWDGTRYSGGEILDPDNGTVYRCRIRVTAGGRNLEVRGYIGVPLIGRTQVWVREPSPS